MTEPADQDHDRDAPLKHRFYTDLASWWPLISAPEEYAEEAAFAASLLRMANPPTRTVLELGSGGGSNAFHLKSEFELTLVDLSEEMLAVSRQLNPECEHLLGDMRTVRLGRCFDAVLVHDAIDYMTTEGRPTTGRHYCVRALPGGWRGGLRTRRHCREFRARHRRWRPRRAGRPGRALPRVVHRP
jgi:SAM-dependent methyltransferase